MHVEAHPSASDMTDERILAAGTDRARTRGWRAPAGAAALALLAVIAVVSIALGARQAQAATVNVNVGDNWFGIPQAQGYSYPKTINAGDTISWQWTTLTLHTVTQCTDNTYTDCTGGFDSGLQNSSSPPFTHTFDTPGIYYYACPIHVTQMMGKVTVNALPTETPTPSETWTPSPETTGTQEPTATATDTPTPTNTATSTSTRTPTSTRTATATPKPGTESVAMIDYAFAPKHLTIRAGDSVRWENTSGTPHTSTSDDDGGWESGSVAAGGSYKRRYDSPGEFAYICTLHATMGQTGTITVEGDATPTATSSGTPPATLTVQAATPLSGTSPPDAPVRPVRGPATFNVTQNEYEFMPATIIIAAGDTVRWVNRGSAPHNTMGDGGAWASPLMMQPGAAFERTFKVTGTYTYRCTLHATLGQTGTIIVRESAVAGMMLPSVGEGGTAAPERWPEAAAMGTGLVATLLLVWSIRRRRA
ncbi:MAG: hypothetical protein HY874_12295 [Chloroflexi bacterium]|nr:hypothetical protein [Chloroflexota bacterium]